MMSEQSHDYLYAFYDPPSRRMKVANIAGCLYGNENLCHRGGVYSVVGHWGENDLIWSKGGKMIGFGLSIVDVVPCTGAKPVSCFRLPVNALNAVVGGRRNDLNPERDSFAEIVKSGNPAPSTFWWLTETWAEFENRLREGISDDYPTDFSSWPPGNLPLARVDNDGEPIGDDFILPLEIVGERMSGIDQIGFKLATKNIPKCIPDSQSS